MSGREDERKEDVSYIWGRKCRRYITKMFTIRKWKEESKWRNLDKNVAQKRVVNYSNIMEIYNNGKRSMKFKCNGNIKSQNEAFVEECRGIERKRKKKLNKKKDDP